MEKTLVKMREYVEFESPDLVTIVIAATDPDPEMAAYIVNAYLHQLEVANQTLALSRARRTRHQVAEALRDTKAELDSTRQRMRDFQVTHGIFSIEKQTEGTLELIANLQTELLSARTERDALKGFSSESSAQMRNLDLKIQALQSQIQQLVGDDLHVLVADSSFVSTGGETSSGTESFFIPLSRIPHLATEYAGILVDLTVQEAKYNVLATQFEQTKIEESQSIPSFEILDWGQRPYKKSGPFRTLFTLAALIGGLLAGIMAAIVLDDLSRRVDERTREELLGILPGFLRRRFRKRDE
jgi:tyrosine-protein kinase Etk/Wzc